MPLLRSLLLIICGSARFDRLGASSFTLGDLTSAIDSSLLQVFLSLALLTMNDCLVVESENAHKPGPIRSIPIDTVSAPRIEARIPR